MTGVKKRRIIKRDGHRCKFCGRTTMLTVDHIQKKSQGGGNEDSNLRCLCIDCNMGREIRFVGPVDGISWGDHRYGNQLRLPLYYGA